MSLVVHDCTVKLLILIFYNADFVHTILYLYMFGKKLKTQKQLERLGIIEILETINRHKVKKDSKDNKNNQDYKRFKIIYDVPGITMPTLN